MIRPRQQKPKTYEWLTAAATVVLAGATVILAIFTHTDSADQLATMRGQLSAMKIGQRAYVTAGSPQLDAGSKTVTFYLSNGGRMPSGPIEAVVHEATVNSASPNLKPDPRNAVEYHWKRSKLAPMPAGLDLFGLVVPVPDFSEQKFTPEGAYQAMLIAGRLTYSDGFPDDGQQEWPFCFQSVYHLALKKIFFVPCEAALVIPRMESRDGYPLNEESD
jgi:hypothetical protein